MPYEFVAESYIRKKMRAVSYLPQEDWQPYIDILSIIGKIHDEAFMDFSKSLNGDWRNLAKVVLYGKGLSREEKIKMFLDREYLVNCPHREEFGVRREINDDVLGFLVRYFEETGYSNERIKLLFKKLHDETQNDKFLEQISESFFNNIEQEHYDNYDFLNISVRDISKMLTYWEVRKSTSEAAKMLEKTFEYMRKKNLDIKEISLKLRDYINVLSSERRDEMYAGIVNEIFEKNVPDGAYDVSEDTKRMVCLASMGGEYYLIENDISSISEEDKKVLCLVLNSDYMYRKHAKEPYGSRDEMMKSLAVDITLGKLRSLKDVQDDWYAQVSDLAIKVFLGEMGVANSEDKYDQLQEFYKTFAEQRRGKYGPSAEEMRGLYIELFDTKKADPEVTDKYETLFNSIFKLPFYFDRTSPYAESREVLFRSDIFNFIFESPMPYEQIIEKAKTFLPPGPLRNFILLAAFLRETNIKYPNQPIYDLVKLKILIENDKSLVVLLEKILPLLNTDKRLGLENMFLLSYLIRRESGKKQTGLGAEDRLSFEKILPSEPGRQKKELKVVSAVKKMGEWFKLIYWVFVYMFLQKGIDLSPKLTLATSKGIFIKRGIDSRIWGTGRSKLILGDINKKRFIDKMRKGKQQGRKIDELLIGWLTAKYKISEDQLDALSEMQIINELMEHITSSWQEIYDTVPSIKKLKNVKQIVAQIDQVKRFKVPPQRAYAILLDYGRITNISSMLNIALLEAFYPNAIQRRYDKTVLRSIINNYNLENILRIVSKLNSKFLKKLEVGYFSMKRKNSGIDKINILFFDYNHPQKLAQLDSVLPQLLEKSIQSILSSDDTFEEKIAYICERFVNSQPARDKYLELIFTEEINLLKSRYNQALESGTIDNQIAELLNRIEKIRVSSKKFFNGYFSNHFLFLAMDLELKLKEGLTFDQKLELLIKYFPDKNYFRDDILKNFLINAETDGQYEKIDALLYTEKKGILEDEQLLGNSLTEQKVKIVLENLSVADRKDLMLWIIGIKEMPLQIREYEELMGISFESIRDLFAISRESKQYAYVGESSRNQLIEFMFWGDKGIISDEKLFADFMNELREFIVKKTNIGKTMSPKLLKKIFSAVIKHSSPRKKLELVQSLALNLSSLFEGEGEERDDYEIISKLMESLGIIGIKIAQMIAYSSDIQIPPKLREKFAELGSKAKPLNKQFAFETIKNLEMQKRFPSIGRLLGSASIKIVFEAILDTSEKVALKIKRPDVAQNLAEDLEMFKKVCNELRSRGVKIPEGFENRASGSIAEDANFEREIENTKKLESQLDEINEQKSYAINAETPSPRSVLFVVPKMYPGSNESVLISELVKGYDLGRGEELIKSGKLTAEEFRQLKGIIFDFLMTQLFEKGYYLGDPHGGNFRIVIEDDGSIKIYLIDVGAMNDLKPKEGETYIETYAKLLKGLACLKLGLKTSDDFIDEAIFFKRAGYLTEDLKTDEMLSEILKKIPEEFRPYASISQFKKAVARDILFGWIRRTEKRTLPGKIEARPSIPPQAIVKKPFMAIGWEYFRDKYKWDEKKVENYIKFKAPAIETAVFQIVGLAIIMLGLPLIGVLWAVLGFAVAHTILEWKVRAKDIGKNFLFRLGFGFLIFLPFAGIASLLALIPSTLLPIIANLINIVITILVASPLVYKFHSKFNIYLYDLKQKPDNELTPLQRRIKKLPFLAISNRIFFVDEFGESLPREPKQEYSWELTGQHFFEIEKFMQRLAGTGYDVAKVEELLRYGFSPGVTLKKDEKFGVVPEIEAPLSEKRKFADHFIMGQYREKVNKIRELVGNAIYKYTLEYHNHAGLGKLDENENFIIFDFLEYNENYSIGSAVDLYFRVVKVLKGLNLFDKLAGGPNITGIMQKCARSIGKKTEETERIVRLTIERLQKEGAWTEVPYMASYLVAPGTYQKYGELNNLPENWYRLDFVQNYNEKGEYIYSVQKRDCELNFAPKYELSFTILPTVAVSAAGIVINAIWGITIFANPLLAVIILVISHIVFLFMHQVTKERILGASLMGAASGVVFWYLSQIIGVSWLMPLIWAITALVNWSIHKIYQIIFPKATLSVGALKLKLNPEFQKDFDKMKKEIEDASRLPVNLKKTFLPMNVNMASPDIKLIKAEENKLFAEYFRVLQNDPTAVKNLKEALVQNGFNKNQILEIFKGKADISLSKQDRRKFYDVMFNKAKIWPLMQKGFDLGISKIEEYLTFKEFAKDFFERYVSEEKISLIKTVASIMFAEDNDEFAILYKQGAASITLEEENALKKGEIRGTTRSSFDMTSGRIQQVNVVVNLDSGGFGNILAITLHEMGHALLYGFLGTIGAQYSEEHDFVVEGIAEHFTVLSFKLLDAYEIFIAKKGLGGKTIFWEWSKWSEFDIARRASDAYKLGYIL
ncbi:MAG: AarF/UbiB family protein, partial [Elusimicrobia bacterium]|nr:AarF/UbiB family protein [Elusimicrobiota bacterium]